MPVRNGDIDSFHKEAVNLFAYFQLVPELVNATQNDMDTLNSIRTAKPILEGQSYTYFGNHRSTCLMGNISYNIDTSAFGDELDPVAQQILSGGILLLAEIGSLDIQASRESFEFLFYYKETCWYSQCYR